MPRLKSGLWGSEPPARHSPLPYTHSPGPRLDTFPNLRKGTVQQNGQLSRLRKLHILLAPVASSTGITGSTYQDFSLLVSCACLSVDSKNCLVTDQRLEAVTGRERAPSTHKQDNCSLVKGKLFFLQLSSLRPESIRLYGPHRILYSSELGV